MRPFLCIFCKCFKAGLIIIIKNMCGMMEWKWVYYLLRVSLTLSLAPKSYTTRFHNPGPLSQDCRPNRSAGKTWALATKQAVKKAILFSVFSSLPCGILNIRTLLILCSFPPNLGLACDCFDQWNLEEVMFGDLWAKTPVGMCWAIQCKMSAHPCSRSGPHGEVFELELSQGETPEPHISNSAAALPAH